MFTHPLELYMACNFSCYIRTEGWIVMGMGSPIHCKDGNILEIVQDRNVTHQYAAIACQIVPFLMTLSDSEGHLCISQGF